MPVNSVCWSAGQLVIVPDFFHTFFEQFKICDQSDLTQNLMKKITLGT